MKKYLSVMMIAACLVGCYNQSSNKPEKPVEPARLTKEQIHKQLEQSTLFAKAYSSADLDNSDFTAHQIAAVKKYKEIYQHVRTVAFESSQHLNNPNIVNQEKGLDYAESREFLEIQNQISLRVANMTKAELKAQHDIALEEAISAFAQ